VRQYKGDQNEAESRVPIHHFSRILGKWRQGKKKCVWGGVKIHVSRDEKETWKFIFIGTSDEKIPWEIWQEIRGECLVRDKDQKKLVVSSLAWNFGALCDLDPKGSSFVPRERNLEED
jgi:hypothetical protein